jgi:hypothetical protein
VRLDFLFLVSSGRIRGVFRAWLGHEMNTCRMLHLDRAIAVHHIVLTG